jgi:Ca2+/Na+ antiporter
MERSEDRHDDDEIIMELKLTRFGKILVSVIVIVLTVAFVASTHFSFGGVIMTGLIWFAVYMYWSRRKALKDLNERDVPLKDYIIIKRREAEEAQRRQVEHALDNKDAELTTVESKKWENFVEDFHSLKSYNDNNSTSNKKKSFNIFRKNNPKGRHRKS